MEKKLGIKILLGIIALGVVSGAVAGIVIATKTTTSKLKNTAAHHQMINNDVVNFIHNNKWSTDKDATKGINIGTVPNDSTTNKGVVLVKSGSTFDWTVKILSTNTSTTYTTISLGDPKDEPSLKNVLKDSKTWTKDKDKSLYPWALTPYLENNASSHQMINSDVVSYILGHQWYTKNDWKTKISIATTPNKNNDNAGIKWVTTGIAYHWKIDILTRTGGTWKQHGILNLGNPKTEKDLIANIGNKNIWNTSSLYAADLPYLPNNASTRILINKDVVNWIYDNLWYSDANHKNAIPIGTTPDLNDDNAGVSLVTNSNGAVSWQVKILTGAGDSWKQYATLNLGNPKNQQDLITTIKDTKTWTNQAEPGKSLYNIHDLNVPIVKDYMVKFLKDYDSWTWTLNGDPGVWHFEFADVPSINVKGGVTYLGSGKYGVYLNPIDDQGNKKELVPLTLSWSTIKDLKYKPIINQIKNHYYIPNHSLTKK